jgi:hypothetical protein
MKRILVICTPRTGSQNLVTYLSNKHRTPVLNELLSSYKSYQSELFQAGMDWSSVFADLQSRESWTSKLMMHHVKTYALHNMIGVEHLSNVTCGILVKTRKAELDNMIMEISGQIINQADQIYYLYRTDFKKQVTSLCASLVTEQYNQNRHDQVNVSTRLVKQVSAGLIDQYQYIEQLYKLYPGEVLSTEELTKQFQVGGAYPAQQVNIDHALIPEFNPERLF